MTPIDIVSWLAVITVLVTYSQITKRPKWFDWANATLWPPVAAPAIIAGAYSSAAISVAFGLIGIWNLVKRNDD